MKDNKLPPGPKGLPIVGSLFDYMRDPVGFYLGITRKYGDIVYYRAGPYQVYVLNHPDYIKDVLVTHSRKIEKGPWTRLLKPFLGEGLLTSEGEFHLRQRRLAQPAFHRQRIAQYGEVMARNSAKVNDRWREGATVDMADEMMGLTLMVVAEALFSGDVEAEVEEIGEALTAFMEWWYLSVLPAFPIIKRLPLPVNRRYARTQYRLDSTIYRLIKEHRERSIEGEDRGDLLTMLLQAQDAEGDGGMMTDKQVHDEAITLFTAGHETTGNALTWTWYLLSQHPDVEAKLHAELDEILGGRLPTMEDLPKLQYTEMVFSEAMRLYPPAWGIDRTVVEDIEVGGYVIPKGAVVTLNQYAMHRHPRYYPNPSKFDPMRWTPEEKAKRPKFAYFPFGGGSRMCIGEQFAWMEGVLVLATLAQKWQARLAPGHKVGTQPLITLRAKGGMPMRVTQRQPALAPKVELEQVAAVT